MLPPSVQQYKNSNPYENLIVDKIPRAVPDLKLDDLKISNIKKPRVDESLELSLIDEESASMRGNSN